MALTEEVMEGVTEEATGNLKEKVSEEGLDFKRRPFLAIDSHSH